MVAPGDQACFSFAKQFGACKGLEPSLDPADCVAGRLHLCLDCRGMHHTKACPRSKKRGSAVSEGDQIDWSGWDDQWAAKIRFDWKQKWGEAPSDRQILDEIRQELAQSAPPPYP